MVFSVHCLSAILDQICSAFTRTMFPSRLFPPTSHKTQAGTYKSGWVPVWLIHHPWEWESGKHAHCILTTSSAPKETILIATENCRVLHICLFSEFLSTYAGSSVVNGTPEGEQLHAVGCMGLHTDHCCVQKACMVQNYPHFLAGIFKITN